MRKSSVTSFVLQQGLRIAPLQGMSSARVFPEIRV